MTLRNLPDDVRENDPRAPWSQPEPPEAVCRTCKQVWPNDGDIPGEDWYERWLEDCAYSDERGNVIVHQPRECPNCEPQCRDDYRDDADLADQHHKERYGA